MANSRDFTGKNRKFTGTKGIVTPKGTTGQRVGSESGELRFNTTTELMEYYDGNQWKPIDASPTISSISTSDAQGTNNILNADGSTLHTITITGGNFGVGAVVKFIGNTGTEYAALSVNRVSGSSITCTTRSNMGTTDDPYDVQITNASGLAATLEDAFSFNAPPVFATASGQLGTVYNGQVISGSTFNASATDAEGNTITYSILSGSLPGSGLTLSSSTGYITGTLSGTPSLGNYPFVVQAATTEGTVNRQFSLQVIANPFITATGGTITTVSGYKYHTFTDSGSFVVSSAGTSPNNAVDYLVVAGGGSGGGYGGAGGAGGLIQNSPSTVVTASTYTVTIGGGGTGGQTNTARGNDGTNSSLTGTGISATATGGGGGGTESQAGKSGGSGGGGGYNSAGGSGTPGQGNAGGQGGANDDPYPSGGGGGAGAIGGAANDGTETSGNGGVGINWKSLGTFYAGGGGGGVAGGSGYTQNGVRGTGGNGGGGTGQKGGYTPATAGEENTGGGGGGGGYNGSTASASSGAGGKGVVIIRYPV